MPDSPTHDDNTPTPQPVASGWSSLWSGLASIITPASQALAQTKAAAVVQQQQQKALAQTWNPAITGPALQAQAWQTAYQTGSGTAPMVSSVSWNGR